MNETRPVEMESVEVEAVLRWENDHGEFRTSEKYLALDDEITLVALSRLIHDAMAESSRHDGGVAYFRGLSFERKVTREAQ